jgi:hypothetical protein
LIFVCLELDLGALIVFIWLVLVVVFGGVV